MDVQPCSVTGRYSAQRCHAADTSTAKKNKKMTKMRRIIDVAPNVAVQRRASARPLEDMVERDSGKKVTSRLP